MFKPIRILIAAAFFALATSGAHAYDHPGHMTTAAIAYAEIQRTRPELIDKLGLLFLAHPDPAPFWVASGAATGNERVRRMFIECARWPDDSKFTSNDRLSWHSARWAIVAPDAPPEAKAAVEAQHGKPTGQAIEAVNLNFAMLRNHESTPTERALGLCWVMHIVGDIHQPMHVSDLYSKEFPIGNAAATLSYVDDPIGDSTIPLHLLWDSNVLRTPSLEAVDEAAAKFTRDYPRSAFPELTSHPVDSPEFFRNWARESHQVAIDWAYDIAAVRDTDSSQDANTLVRNMVNFILNGVSPVKEAPAVPADYWAKLQQTTERRITLAGYRIADLLIAAADDIQAKQEFIGR